MNLAATMSLDTASFMGPLRGVMGGLRGLLGIAGAAGGIVGMVAGLRSGLRMGSELSDLKDRTGAAVGELVLLRQAFDDTGVGAAAVPTAIQYMQKALSGISEEGKPTVQTFKALGLDMKALKGLAPTDAILKIGAAINGLGSEADKTEAAMAIFGRSGAALKQFFADPQAIEKVRAGLGSLPQVLERDAAMLDSLDDSIGRLRANSRGLFVGIASEVAPALNGILDGLRGIDLTRVGQQIGRVVAILGEAFASGKLSDLVGLSLTVGLQTAFSALTKGDFWKGLGNIIVGSFAGLQAFLFKIFTAPISYLSGGIRKAVDEMKEWLGGIPKLGEWMGLSGHKAQSFDYHRRQAERENQVLGDDFQAIADESMALGRSQMAGAWDAAAADMTPEKDRLAVLLGELNGAVESRADELRAASAAPAAGTGSNSPASALSEGDKARGPEVDQWAKVGLFVGGGGGPALDYNRRTARATELTAAAARRMAEAIENLAPTGAAVWANA
jgi:hypothetical protein